MKHGNKVRVGISEFPPLVFKEDGKYKGFEIDLWKKIVNYLDLNTKDYELYSFDKLLKKIEKKEIDVAFAGITKTEEREEKMDFSHLDFESGLHIMTSTNQGLGLFKSLKLFFSRDIMNVLYTLVVFIAISGNLIWFFERGKSVSESYFAGIFESVWWSVVTVSSVGYGDITPVTVVGRIIGIIVILCGFAIFSFFVAQISSFITLSKIKSNLQKPDELRDVKVATVRGTYSVGFLKSIKAKVHEYSTINKAIKSLKKGDVRAIVFDAPILIHIANNDPDLKISGPLFNIQNCGIAFKENSSLREKVNKALLHIKETGEYQEIYNKWFK